MLLEILWNLKSYFRRHKNVSTFSYNKLQLLSYILSMTQFASCQENKTFPVEKSQFTLQTFGRILHTEK